MRLASKARTGPKDFLNYIHHYLCSACLICGKWCFYKMEAAINQIFAVFLQGKKGAMKEVSAKFSRAIKKLGRDKLCCHNTPWLLWTGPIWRQTGSKELSRCHTHSPWRDPFHDHSKLLAERMPSFAAPTWEIGPWNLAVWKLPANLRL